MRFTQVCSTILFLNGLVQAAKDGIDSLVGPDSLQLSDAHRHVSRGAYGSYPVRRTPRHGPRRPQDPSTDTDPSDTVSQTDKSGNSTDNALPGGFNAQICLNKATLQVGSESDGQVGGDIEAGQAASLTDAANFINFCAGKTLTNGAQVVEGSCNGIVMGDIPAQAKMVSSIIVSPEPGQAIAANKTFTIKVQIQNLVAGRFTNPLNTYYSAPQTLVGGIIEGHAHVVIQDMGGSFTPTTALDATKFAFFKGINDAGDGKGLLSAVVTGGLPPGFYRVCSMASAGNHQPVVMPVAQRGAQDDCTKFKIVARGRRSVEEDPEVRTQVEPVGRVPDNKGSRIWVEYN